MKNRIYAAAVLTLLSAGCSSTSYPFIVAEDTVEIQYTLSSGGTVDVLVTNSYMTVVRTLADSQEQEEGTHTVSWDLMDDNGVYPGDGLYTAEVYLGGTRVFVQVLEVNRQ